MEETKSRLQCTPDNIHTEQDLGTLTWEQTMGRESCAEKAVVGETREDLV